MQKVSLLTLLLCFCAQMSAAAASKSICPFENSHLERLPLQKVHARVETEIKMPADRGSECLVYISQIPVLERQEDCSTRIKSGKISGQKFTELSAQKRTMLRLLIQNKSVKAKTMHVSSTLSATLYQSRLAAGSSSKSIPSLSKQDQAAFLDPSFSIDYDAKVFQNYLDRLNLRKKESESDIGFAWRAFNTMRRKFRYSWSPDLDRRNSITCKTNATDCGGLSYLFCGIMRANKIPARPLVGRWTSSSSRTEDASGYFNCHVKSEFFDKNIGWIPVDISEAVSNRRKKSSEYFGVDKGDFIAFHVNPDLVLEGPDNSLKKVRSMPDYRIWIKSGKKITIPPRNIRWTVDRL